MIFLSHTHADKPLIEPAAQRLASVFGPEKVFYDSWAIQPGDGIIDRLNAGLENCKFFFFFVSKKSLQSNMVKLEWQNALLKSTRGDTKIIPVRIDDVLMPAILAQTLYIDIFTQGLETGVRQMVDVIAGRSTYRPSTGEFQNVRAYVRRDGSKLRIEFRAEAYMEPHSRYLVLVDNGQDEISFAAIGEGMFESGFNEGVRLDDGRTVNAILMARSTATSPGFPFIVELTPVPGASIRFVGAMRIVNRDSFGGIPVVFAN